MLTKYLVIVAYFAVLCMIGWAAARRVSGGGLKEFFTGGKKLGYWVAAFSAQATGESAWLLLGLTGMGAIAGVSAYWVVVGEVIGVAIAWFLMAKPFKHACDKYDAITVPDYLSARFQTTTHRLRALSALVLAIFIVIYVSAQIDATGSAFESFLGWNYFIGAAVGFLIVVTYCVAGGFLAACWTDMFQGVVMLSALVALPVIVFFGMDASIGDITAKLGAVDPGLLNIWGASGLTLMNVMTLLGMITIGIGFIGSPQIFVRFLSVKDDGEIERGKWVAVLFTLLADSAAVSIGILGRYLFTEMGDDPNAIMGNAAQNALPMLVEHTFSAVLVGFYVAAVLSAIMSTVSSLLVLASSAVTRDLYQVILRPDLQDQDLGKTSRKVTLTLSLIALAIALSVAVISPERTIFWFVIFGWSGIAACFCPMMLLALFWKGYNEAGAIASMLVGFLCIPLFKFAMPGLPVVGAYLAQLEPLPPAFVLALLAGFVASKWKGQRVGAGLPQPQAA